MNASSYQEIAEGLKASIRNGTFVPGDKLPALRVLAKMNGVALGTAQRAVAELQRDGFIDANGRNGCVVLGDWAAAALPAVGRAAHPGTLKIGLVADWIERENRFPSPYLPIIGRLLAERVFGMGGQLLHFTLEDESHGATAKLREQVKASGVDALLLLSGSPDWALEFSGAAGCVCVRFARDSNLNEGMDVIGVEDAWAITELTKRLCQMGHRRLAFAGIDPSLPDYRWVAPRLKAWEAGLHASGVPFGPEDVFFFPDCPAVAAAAGALREHSAVVCGNDHMAMAVVAALRGAGFRVPEDVSVTGYDNLQELVVNAELTTVAVPEGRVVSTFLSYVSRRLAQDEALGDHVTILLRPVLIPRTSWAPPMSATKGVTAS